MPAYTWQTDPFGYMGANSPNFIAAGQPEFARGDLENEKARVAAGGAPTFNPILAGQYNNIPAYDLNAGQSYSDFLAREAARTQAGPHTGPYTNNPTLNWNFLNQYSNAIPTSNFRLPTYQDPKGVVYAIRAGTTALPEWATNVTPNWQQLIGGGQAQWGNPGAPTYQPGQNIFAAPPAITPDQEVNPNPVEGIRSVPGGDNEFDFVRKNVGLDTDPIPNLFQTATGTFSSNPTGYIGTPLPQQEPVQFPTGPTGGTMFGPSSFTGTLDPSGNLPVGWDYSGPSAGMATQPGGTGSNVVTMAPVVTSTSQSNFLSTLARNTLLGGIPGAAYTIGSRLFSGPVQTNLPLDPDRTPVAPVTATGTSEPTEVPGVNTNFVPPGGYGPISSYTYGPTLTLPPVTVTATSTPSTTAPLNPYYTAPRPVTPTLRTDPGVSTLPTVTVNAPPTTTGPSAIVEIPGRTLTVPGQSIINQVYGPSLTPTTPAPTTTTPSTRVTTPTTGTGTGGGGTTTGPSYSAPATIPGGRNVLSEGQQTLAAYNQLMPGLLDLYRGAASGYSSADAARLAALTGQGSDYATTQANLNALAAQQTLQANRALREGNLADAQALSMQAEQLKRQANPELYAGMEQFQGAAGSQVAADLAKLQAAQARQLSPEDVRNAQQAAREAYSARGLVMGPGAIGAEILNRENLARQREQEARQNLATSMGQLYQGIGARTANVFDPLAATLSQQYGMQTQNIGNTGQLFGQAGNLAGGAYTNQMAANIFNPWSPYAQDVYGTNFNAAVAQQIAAANNAAAIEAARQSAGATTSAANTALWSRLIGGGLGGLIGGGMIG